MRQSSIGLLLGCVGLSTASLWDALFWDEDPQPDLWVIKTADPYVTQAAVSVTVNGVATTTVSNIEFAYATATDAVDAPVGAAGDVAIQLTTSLKSKIFDAYKAECGLPARMKRQTGASCQARAINRIMQDPSFNVELAEASQAEASAAELVDLVASGAVAVASNKWTQATVAAWVIFQFRDTLAKSADAVSDVLTIPKAKTKPVPKCPDKKDLKCEDPKCLGEDKLACTVAPNTGCKCDSLDQVFVVQSATNLDAQMAAYKQMDDYNKVYMSVADALNLGTRTCNPEKTTMKMKQKTGIDLGNKFCSARKGSVLTVGKRQSTGLMYVGDGGVWERYDNIDSGMQTIKGVTWQITYSAMKKNTDECKGEILLDEEICKRGVAEVVNGCDTNTLTEKHGGYFTIGGTRCSIIAVTLDRSVNILDS